LPSFVNFDQSDLKISIQMASGFDNQYNFTLSVIEPKSGLIPLNPFSFLVDVTSYNEPPYFTSALQDIDLSETELAREEVVIKLPPVADRQNHRI